MWISTFLLLLTVTVSFKLIKGESNFTTINPATTESRVEFLKKAGTIESDIEILNEEAASESQSELLRKLSTRIVNGTKAVLSQFPQQVSLRLSYDGSHFCGGSMLTPKWVLTAAHCTWLDEHGTIIEPKDVSVVAGEIQLKDTNDARTVRNVLSIIIHPNFSYRTLHNDLALLELKTPICFSNYVHAVPLARAPTEAKITCQVSGWGYERFGANKVSYNLLYANVPVVDIIECRRLMQNFSLVPKGIMCAGYLEGGRDACQGDSGGGMICSGLLTGIVSGGKGCALPKLPGLYADIHVYIDWIEKYVDFSKEIKFCSNASTFASSVFASVLVLVLHINQWAGRIL